jgi:hypothetical protein
VVSQVLTKREMKAGSVPQPTFQPWFNSALKCHVRKNLTAQRAVRRQKIHKFQPILTLHKADPCALEDDLPIPS